MRLGNVRTAQWIAGAGGVVLLVSMFLDWYGTVVGVGGGSAFEHPGTAGAAADALLVVACAVPIVGVPLAAGSRSPGIPVAASSLTTLSGALAVLLVAGRMFLQPGPDEFVTLNVWIFVALFAAGAIVYGGWIGTKDEAVASGADSAPPAPAPATPATPSAAATPAGTASAAATPSTTGGTPVAGPAAAAPAQTTAAGVRVPQAPSGSQASNQPQRGTKMDLSNVKTGGRIAAIGGLVLLISILFFNWYKVGGEVGGAVEAFGNLTGADTDTGFGAWDGEGFFGMIANLVMLAAGLAAIGLAVLAAMSRSVALPAPPSTVIGGLGIAAVVLIVLRMVLQPGEGQFVDLEWGIFVALLGAVAIAAGGFMSMRDEGTSFGEASDQIRRSTSAPGAGQPPPSQPPGAGQPPQGQPPAGGQPPSGGPPPPGGPPS